MDQYDKVIAWKKAIHYCTVSGDENCSNCIYATALLRCVFSMDVVVQFKVESFMVCDNYEEVVALPAGADDETS